VDLTEFLLARIAEDEVAARAASIGSAEWRLDDLDESVLWWPPERAEVIEKERQHGLPLSDHWRGMTIESAGDQIAPHVVRWDPAHVLAECEIKRRIAAEHPKYDGYGLGAYCQVCAPCDADGNPDVYDDTHWPCPTLRLLALPYADHPDYREEWRP